MAAQDIQARIRARVWQAIAQNDLDLGALDAQTRERLVDVVAAAALEAMNSELNDKAAAVNDKDVPQAIMTAEAELGDEEILWQGRPFMSVSEYYMITNERIRVAQGLLGRNYQNIELVRVEDVDYHQSTSERMVNMGDIEIRSHDPHSPLIILENVANPEQVYEILRRAVKQARKDHGMTFQEEM
jgi:hypothetical protein